MRPHRFQIGQEVVLKVGRYSNAPVGRYRVIAVVPERDNSPQYRIRNDAERHERMVSEDSLGACAEIANPHAHGAGFPSPDRIAAGRPGSHETLEYARQRNSDSDGTMRRLKRLVEDCRLI